MPKFPGFSHRLSQISGSVFEKFLPIMREKGEDMVKLHIGDSYLPPPYSLPLDKSFLDNHPYFNRYCNTHGVQELRKALCGKVSSDNNLEADENDIMITCGATNALSASVMSIINPDEEVLTLTPCWPFFLGMVKIAGGVVVEAPFYIPLYCDPEIDIQEYLSKFITDKTVALYLNTPNNPSGKVLNKENLLQICELVKRRNLWLISDEAYDGMTYDDHVHLSVASFPDMWERTLSVFTFSKVFMFAGLRLGYIVAPNSALRNLNKMMVHQLYSPSTLAQYMMIKPLLRRREWGGEFVKHCHELRAIASGNLKTPHHQPEGAYYLFFSIKDLLRGRNYWDVIDECLESGVSVAPGCDFGKDFSDYIRICFAGETPKRLKIGIKRLNQIFK